MKPGQNRYILRYNIDNDQEYQIFIKETEGLFKQGYVLTRFIEKEGES